jgi:hypothetical protein
MLKNRVGLATVVLGSALTLLSPIVSSARDWDDYRGNRDSGYSMSRHERHEMEERRERARREERKRWERMRRQDYYRDGYVDRGYGYTDRNNGYGEPRESYDQYGTWRR